MKPRLRGGNRQSVQWNNEWWCVTPRLPLREGGASGRDTRQRERAWGQTEAELQGGGWRGRGKQEKQPSGNNAHPVVGSSCPNLDSEEKPRRLVSSHAETWQTGRKTDACHTLMSTQTDLDLKITNTFPHSSQILSNTYILVTYYIASCARLSKKALKKRNTGCICVGVFHTAISCHCQMPQ